jgi:nondiscriminating glutamyl-tRNA synthetase
MDEDFKFIKPGEVRVRFAPSPTGLLHIGGARTALFNYLFAKKYEGVFILRIEDTDKERSKPEFEKDILESLKWLGIEWDEGPDVGGDYGPYRQSERGEIYKKYLEKLLAKGKAYYCFCSEEDLEAMRQYQLSIGQPPRYNGKCRDLPKETVEKYLKEKRSYVIRFKVEEKKVEFEDLIRGKIEFDTSLMGDFVIAKNFTLPLYNFACVVDDFEMKISHVIRAEEHISNTPKQILIQEALGFPRPQYAHIPLILGPDRSKLSKRHGATSILEYKKQGYLPEALVNFMALLGWNPGDNREFFSLNSLIKEFSLERVQKSGAVFNIKKLDFLNGFYIRQRSTEKITELCLPYLIESGLLKPEFKEIQYPPAYGPKEIVQSYKVSETGEEINFEVLKKIVFLYQRRLKKLSEISELTDFFFRKKLEYDKNLLRWKEMEEKEVFKAIDKLENIFSKIKEEEWNAKNLEKILMEEAKEFSKEIGKEVGDRGYLLWPLRVALTGKEASAGPFEIAEILGKEKTLKRIKEAKEILK